ncbi:GntR family transcriptional regulator [Ancylobacter sp. MQZ15Z-1]|uniref:GntR family transcriptional regulator n=1 Tax=Ancylobacter mangrovi TaxID=2972472 RepID=A0A9X2T2E4_9HYPH|nr:GntR family transcriptional regulator [Ancylobacter mangrovi]MCS0495787.1 GntR family transcriptional regulator [Ancylobacter mangrovi]
MARSPSQNRFRLANQILEVVRDGRFEVGHHLREQQFGDLLQVSRTPVRAALSLLAEHGVVEARRHQGFFLKATPEELHRFSLEVPPSADQDLYSDIVQDRLAGRLPASFTQTEIARRYDVDRALLQRTLTRLVDDGLLERNTGRGWTFLPALDTGMALQNSYDFRLITEPQGLLVPTFKADPAALERLRIQHLYLETHPRIATVDARQLFDTDAHFHETIAGFSGNVFLLQAIQQQNRLRRLLEFGGYVNRRRVRDWCREHLAILDAVAAGDQAGAAEIMRLHLTNAFSAVPSFETGRRA